MAAVAGQILPHGGIFYCAKCNSSVQVKKGASIPECPDCGNDTYDEPKGKTSE